MNPSESYNVLIICQSSEESDRIGSMLSNYGLTCQWHQSASYDDLEALLDRTRQSTSFQFNFSADGLPLNANIENDLPYWNVIIYHSDKTEISLQQVFQALKSKKQDIPIVSLVDSSNRDVGVIDHLRKGVASTIVIDEDIHLALSIKKEVNHQSERLKTRLIEENLQKQSSKIKNLIENSRDGIAFIEDGLIIYCNQSFSDFLSYEKDDIECALSLNDILNEEHQFITAKLNKVSSGEPVPYSKPQNLTFLNSEGINIDAISSFSLTQYEKSPCIQLCLLFSEPNPANNQKSNANKKNGPSNLENSIADNSERIYENISKLLKSARDNHTLHAVGLISIANDTKIVTENIGLINRSEIIFDLQNQLTPYLPESESLEWLDHQHILWTIPDTDTDTINSRSQQLIEQAGQLFLQSREKTIRAKLSIGIGLINDKTSSAEEAIEFSRLAKRNLVTQDKLFEGGFSIYEPQKLEQMAAENDISHMLKSALDKNKFRLMFQPIISLRGTELEQYEVFLRMVDKENKEISPDLFLDKAKELKLLSRIDRYVILESVKRLASHRNHGHQPKLIINISEQSILDNNMASWIKTALSAADLPPSEVIFQVSEKTAGSFLKATQYFIEELHKRHIMTSITNFGRSSHPFNLLDHINFDYVKIDGSIMNEFQENPSSSRMLDMIKLLIQNKRSCIVPFVENASALSHLWQAGAHYIQGHYLQKPHWEMNYDFQIGS